MTRRRYRAVDVKNAQVDGLLDRIAGDRVIVGIDVAKQDMYAAVVDDALEQHGIVKWQHPTESRAFLGYLERLRDLEVEVEVVMEPSGVCGDALRHHVLAKGFPVFRVQPKRAHDAKEVWDACLACTTPNPL